MNKTLIEGQRFSKATCVVILDNESKFLNNAVVMNADASDKFLFACDLGNPIFKDKVESMSKKGEIAYFILKNMDKLTTEKQDRYIGLIKDREFMGYNLPDNVIIVLTVENEDTIKNLSPNLIQFFVNAI